MNKPEIFHLLQEAFDGLVAGGILEAEIAIKDNTVLIGPDTVLDSIGFVTLFMDLEERLGEIAGEEIYLLIDEIHEFNPEDSFLTVEVLADYIHEMMEKLNK